MGNPNIYENLGENSEKAAQFFGKFENFLNEKIRTAPLAATPHMCISSELLPLFLFYLAASRRAALVYNGLYRICVSLKSICHSKTEGNLTKKIAYLVLTATCL